MLRLLAIINIVLIWSPFSFGQKIADPCFLSLTEFGRFYGTDDLRNVCDCGSLDDNYGVDIIEWNGTEWIGRVPHANVDLAPPASVCNVRAFWMGFQWWSKDGEAIALRLDQPLKKGEQYSFQFTYASNGSGSDGNFSPIVYSDSKKIPFLLKKAYKIGRLPGANGWTTNTFTFTASEIQDGHDWIILHAFESSGIVLSECRPEIQFPENLLPPDSLICAGDSLTVHAAYSPYLKYLWNDGDTVTSKVITEPQTLQLTVEQNGCTTHDEMIISTRDCELRMVMPNYFSPNGDDYNNLFVPMDYNYVIDGEIIIYNRWGKQLFRGDLFAGWDGQSDGKEVSSGVYYYEAFYTDEDYNQYTTKGTVTLAR